MWQGIISVSIQNIIINKACFMMVYLIASLSSSSYSSFPDNPEEEAFRDADRVWLCLASASVPDSAQWPVLSVSTTLFFTRTTGPPQVLLHPLGETVSACSQAVKCLKLEYMWPVGGCKVQSLDRRIWSFTVHHVFTEQWFSFSYEQTGHSSCSSVCFLVCAPLGGPASVSVSLPDFENTGML